MNSSSWSPVYCPVDAFRRRPYFDPVKTTVDIDEALLREAEARARQQGKPLAMFLEEALRSVIQASPLTNGQSASPSEVADALEGNDPFFTALDDIRALGRAWVAKPTVDVR